MGYPTNTIANLAKISVKPVLWEVIQDEDATYWMRATYVEPERADFFEIVTARGALKYYRTLNALMSDIAIVTPEPLVEFHLLHQPVMANRHG